MATEVVPGPGDLDSTGSVELRLIPDKKKICFIISHENLAPDNPILGHVHKGKLGELGSVVVTLFEGIPGQKSSSRNESAAACSGARRRRPA